ncbi:FitA-like ribbon-helix-helix domain-containing protein [Candidatus Palauibacter sp.]|uniref:FitA-like ribbon-helix-helix domain-containing protein n=1 Tax=Candidatus Palauibacter sp. TaxID=3101350 RepID=UPI003AF30BD7
MPNLALRGIPADLHRELKEAAIRNHRSLNGEIVARLSASVRPAPVDVKALLHRIQLRHEMLGTLDLSEDKLQRLRNAGRQ